MNNKREFIQILPTAKMNQAFADLPIIWYNAIKEYIDNSIDASATVCQIYASDSTGSPDLKPGYFDQLEIIDNGKGMSSEGLKSGWAYASKTKYNDNSHGRFGMGLTVASVRLAKQVKIITRQKNGDWFTLEWDSSWSEELDWAVQFGKSTDDEIQYFCKRMNNIDKSADSQSNPHGTLIILSSLAFDFSDEKRFDDNVNLRIGTLKNNMLKHIGISHHAHIRGTNWTMGYDTPDDKIDVHQCKIKFNNTDIEPIDPIFDLYENDLSELIYDSYDDNAEKLKSCPNLRVRGFLVKPLTQEERTKHGIQNKRDHGIYFSRQGRYIALATAGRKILGNKCGWHAADDAFVRILVSWDKKGDSDIQQLSFMKDSLTLLPIQQEEIIELIKPIKRLSLAQHEKYVAGRARVTEDQQKNREEVDKESSLTLQSGVDSGNIDVPLVEIEKRTPGTGKKREKPKTLEPKKRARNPRNVQTKIPTISWNYSNWGEDGQLFSSSLNGSDFIITLNQDSKFFIFTEQNNLIDNEVFRYLIYSLAVAEKNAERDNSKRHTNVKMYLNDMEKILDQSLGQMVLSGSNLMIEDLEQNTKDIEDLDFDDAAA